MMIRFTQWLDERMFAELKRIGKQDDRTVGWLIRQAVKEFIERRKSNVAK
jgi:predicted transcriptional regulator